MAHRFSFVSSRSLATLVAGCLASVLVTGCNDPELEKQAAYERQFNEVCASYATTMGGHPDLLSSNPSAESVAALRGVAERAKGLSGGTPVQQAAARKLAASVYRTAGSINLSRATSLESGEEVVRGLVNTANGIAADLEALATAADATDVSGARKFAEGKKAESQQAATAIAAASKQLEGPVANLDQQISASAGKIAQLNQDIAVLLRKARESSATAGLALIEEASSMRAEVRSLSKTMSNNSIDTDELKSRARMASAAMREAQGMQDATKAAIDLLGSFKADIEGQAAKTRAMAADLRKNADALRKALADERAGVLKAAYEAAAKDFADAASDGEGEAFKQTITCEELRMRVSEVGGLGAQGRMLASSTGGAGAAGLGEIKTAAEAAIAALKEKAGAAADMFANAGEDPALAGIKTYVDGVKKMADGLTVDSLLSPPAAEPTKAAAASRASSGRSMSGAGGAGAGGNDDLDALVARFEAAGSDPVAASDMFVDLIDDSSANAKAMKGMMSSSIDAMKPLIAAMAEKFGASAMGKGGAMAGGMPGMASPASMGNLTKKSNDGSTAVYTTVDGKEINFVKTSSGWKLDMLAGIEPAQAEMMAQAAPMMGMMIGPMKKAAADVAARVKAGEFATAEEAQAAVQQAIMKAAGGAMGGGGAGRGPRGGRPAGAGAPGGAGVEN